MLNCLKFDLFKIAKSKLILGVSLCCLVVDLIVLFMQVVNSESSSVLFCLTIGMGAQNGFGIFLFTTLFICKDFTSGYVKNFYTGIAKIKYVLSKAIVICLYVISYYLIYSLFTIISVFTIGPKCFFVWTYDHLLIRCLWTIVGNISVGIVTMFFCFLLKREYLVILILLPWALYLQGELIQSVDKIIRDITWEIDPYANPFSINDINLFTITCVIPKQGWDWRWFLHIIYSSTAFLWSYLLYKKKKI